MPKMTPFPVIGKPSMINRLLDRRNSLRLFIFAITIAYGVVPLSLSAAGQGGPAFLQLAALAGLAVIAMWLGSCISIFDYRFRPESLRLAIKAKTFIAITWLIFIIFIIYTFATAPSIPFLSALSGVETIELSEERGAFLKGREGVEIFLPYLNAILVFTIVPYSIILLYVMKSPRRHFASVAFIFYCISFMQKALFLNLILPLIALLAAKNLLNGRILLLFFGSSVLALIFATALAMHGWDASNFSSGDYFSARYIPVNPLDYAVWRAIAVPVFTASDTLIVHQDQFRGESFVGATSSSVAFILGVERVNLERYVFEYQFGGWNEIANSNTVFFIDGFVNFGWGGTVLFGLFVGQIFRWFRISRDVAFQSLWPLFSWLLFSGPLIGMLLGSGWAYMLFHALFIRVHQKPAVEASKIE